MTQPLDQIDVELRKHFDLPGPLPQLRLARGKTALVIIDMHYFDAHRDGEWARRARSHGIADRVEWFFDRLETVTVPAIKRLLGACREAGFDVVYTRVSSITRDGREMSWRYRLWNITVPIDEFDSQFLPEIAPQPNDIIINKTATSAFIGSHLDRVLRNIGIENLIFCGVMTSGCVESNVRDGADSGYQVMVAEDACAALSKQAHDNAINAMNLIFATIKSTDEIVAQIRADTLAQV